MQPVDYSHDRLEDWGVWVLDNGLPELPEQIEIGQAIPVAYWAGPDAGAVIFLIRYEPGDDADDDASAVDEDVHCFHRNGSEWDSANGDGGTEWGFGIELRRQAVPADHLRWGGYLGAGGDGWACRAFDGVAGTRATWVDVETAGTIDRRPINAPLGVFVVCVPDEVEATIRVSDSNGEELSRHVV